MVAYQVEIFPSLFRGCPRRVADGAMIVESREIPTGVHPALLQGLESKPPRLTVARDVRLDQLRV